MTFGTRSAWLAALLGLVACGDDTMPSPPVPVVARTDVADAATCPHGGVVVRSGPDRNGNGVLDDSEIAAATPVCQDAAVTPEPPPPVRVRLDDEPAGANCQNGGTAVRSGADTDRDGALDDDEVVATDYVCDASLLTRMESEPAGANCAGGGIAFHVGRDGDLDGVLGADEVEWTEYECTDVLSRAVTVRTAADLATLADIRVITGSLEIVGTSIAAIDLPALELVGGRIVVEDNAALTRLSLPALAAVDGYLGLSLNPRLAELDLGQLRRVEGALYVLSNGALVTLGGLDALLSVDRSIEIRNNGLLAATALPSLGLVGGDITVSGNPKLTALDLSLFERAGDVVVTDNAALAAVELWVSGLLCSSCLVPVGTIAVARNAALATVRLYGTSFAAVDVYGNDALATFTMTADRVDGHMRVQGAALDEVNIYERSSIDDGIAIGGHLTITGPVTWLSTGFSEATVGGLTLDGSRLTNLDRVIPYVRGDLELRNNDALIRATFLEVTGGVRIADNDAFRAFWIFEQDVIHGDVVVTGNAVLEHVNGLQNTREIRGSLIVVDNPRLTMPAMYGLRHVEGDLRLSGLPALEVLHLNELETIGGGLSVTSTGLRVWPGDRFGGGLAALRSVGWVSIGDNHALEEIDLSALVSAGDWFHIYDNPALRRLGLASFQYVDTISIWDNAALPVCEIEELFARTSAGSERQDGNDDDGACE
jgi:hypothetical protein